MKLKNKLTIVTGASTGIGRAIAVEFGKDGAQVFLAARSKNKLKQTSYILV